MSSSSLVLNPYQSARIHERPQSQTFNPFAEQEVFARKHWLRRHLTLSGRIEGEVIWDARCATEFVKVNGRVAVQQTAYFYVPRFDFQIQAGKKLVPASIEVRIRGLVFLSGFRLYLDGDLTYQEGQF